MPGKLEPQFQPDVFEFFMLLTADDVPDMKASITPVATHPNATIMVGGLWGKRVLSGDTFKSGVRLGENKVRRRRRLTHIRLTNPVC